MSVADCIRTQGSECLGVYVSACVSVCMCLSGAGVGVSLSRLPTCVHPRSPESRADLSGASECDCRSRSRETDTQREAVEGKMRGESEEIGDQEERE